MHKSRLYYLESFSLIASTFRFIFSNGRRIGAPYVVYLGKVLPAVCLVRDRGSYPRK